MSLTDHERRQLAQISAALTATDPALAVRFAYPPKRSRCSTATAFAMMAALAALVGGLPLAMVSPLWGSCLSIAGFLALCACTFILTQRHPSSRRLRRRVFTLDQPPEARSKT